MKKKNIFVFAIAITALSFIDLWAQDVQVQGTAVTDSARDQAQASYISRPKPFPEDLNIAAQFSYAIDKSSNFQDYKTIKQAWMSKLMSNTLDTLSRLQSDLKSTMSQLQQKSTEIQALQTDLGAARADLQTKNSFSFLGIMVSKAGYDSIMWGIIIGLAVALGFVIAAFRRSYAVTAQTKKDLDEIKDEFEKFRKKALKSKEEAVRQLYDELQKYKAGK